MRKLKLGDYVLVKRAMMDEHSIGRIIRVVRVNDLSGTVFLKGCKYGWSNSDTSLKLASKKEKLLYDLRR